MANTGVDICQKALTLLGAGEIQSFNDGSDLAKTCSAIYPDLKESALAETHWNFATKKRQLARESDTPVSEWDYQYSLPSDLLLGPHSAFSDANTKEPIPAEDWEIVDGKLMTDYQTIYVDYTRDVAETEFPAYFTRFLYHAVASEIAKSVTDQTTTAEFYQRKAYGLPSDNQEGGLLSKAKRKDSQTQATQTIGDFPLTDVRFGS